MGAAASSATGGSACTTGSGAGSGSGACSTTLGPLPRAGFRLKFASSSWPTSTEVMDSVPTTVPGGLPSWKGVGWFDEARLVSYDGASLLLLGLLL